MTADLKAMLDELMGKDRDLSLQEREKQAEHWSDESVCKYFLVKFCPHDLFGNTKADLGPCKAATHDVKIREDYRKSLRYKKMGYEKDFVRTLENTIDDMERKIKRQHERLEHDERYMRQEQAKADDVRNNRLEVLNTEIDAMLEKMAEAGSEGNVDEAQQMMKQVDAMRQEREAIKAAKLEEPQKKVFLVKQNVPFINEMKHMEVCPVCGAFLVVNDTQTRVDAHLAGKQHVGYKMIREAIKSIREELEADEKAAEEARLAGIKRVAEKDKVEESRVDDRVRSRNDREKSRDASRRRSRDRSRSHRVDDKRDRDRDRYDRQDRSRDQRDRSRERRNRDRSRERRKSRDAGRSERKSSRDRSRERKSSRDRSRERGRKSSKERSRRSSRDNEPAKTTEKKEDGPATEENTNMEEEKHDNTGETKDDFSEKADKDMQNGEAQEEEKKTSEEGETTKERRRSRSRDRRNRSRDRRSRSRDRKRDRSRDRSRRSRDRKSRERRRRSMSRERRRSRSYERKRSRH